MPAIYEIDLRGPRFARVNDAMCEMPGYTREELLAQSPFDLLRARPFTLHGDKRPMPFRRAIPRDAPALARLQIESYRTAYAHLLPRSYLDRLSQAEEEQDWRNLVISNPEDVLYIAQTNTGDITGFALGRAGPAEIAPYDGELVSMHVQGRYQRQGIGRELLALVARALAEQGCTSLMLWVLAGNPAQRFYERLGGVLIGEHTIPLGDEVTAAEVAYGWPRIADLYQET